MPSRPVVPRERREPPRVTIRTLREAHGLTLPMLVARISEQGVGVTADHLSNCELGWKRPSNALLHAWAPAGDPAEALAAVLARVRLRLARDPAQSAA